MPESMVIWFLYLLVCPCSDIIQCLHERSGGKQYNIMSSVTIVRELSCIDAGPFMCMHVLRIAMSSG